MTKHILLLLMLCTFAAASFAAEPVALIDPADPLGNWSFADGPEFPGAQGTLALAAESFRDRPVLSLHGDFTKGGNYVQASVALPKAKIDTLSFWVNSPAGSQRIPIRLIDADSRCHQINLKLNEKGGWQHIVLPIDDFFKKMGTPGAIDIVANYEVWDAVQESQRNNKELPSGANLAILASRAMGTTKGTILLSDVLFYPSDENVTSVSKTIQLDEMLQAGEVDWGFNLGQEFAGAKGGLDLVPDQPEAGKQAMRLHADFTAGGQYVGVRKTFEHLNVEAMRVIRIKVRTETAKSFALRLLDGSGQCHQRKGLPLTPDGQWHELVIVPEQIAGGEHWGGKNDGQWHDSVQLIELMLNIRSDENSKPDLLLTDMRADVLVAARVKPASFAETFDTQSSLPKGWGHTGDIAVDASGAATEEKSLALRRELSALQTETGATGRTFDAQPGPWQIQYAWKAKLHSPDNSYHGSVALEALGSADRVLETIPVGIGYGTQDWQQVSQSIRLPEGTRRARFRIQLNKTYGTFWVDDLSASPMTVGPTEQRVERILLASDAVGNLFFPGDPVVVRATVEARKPLREDEQQMHYSLRDYWGAEQIPPGRVTLQRVGRKGPSFVYSAEIRLPQQQLAVGKYYELNVAIEQPGGEPVREFSGLAVLPTAAAKQHKPEDIPFTIRNWDSRIGVYFDLADRIGLRMLGVWGGWSPDAPYKPHCPGSDRCRELGAKWITGTPAATVERKGFTEYSEEALRQGMKNFLAEYADSGMAMIAMGNEPHGTGDKVLENVRAYRAIYETVKAFDPKIHVIGTSVEPNEEYFKAGYQNYLDSYDFHIYEHYTNVRRTIREYRELMKKYDAVKPIHSTELGLNSQGQTRHAVALEMIKKFTVFFAEGGATVSWFTIQYPDPQGKARGQFGDSHCIFDCKYNLYNPRLDAITHYQMLNGICDKRFVEEQHYPGGAQAYLFRNGKGDCLQVVWLENHRRDVLVPLPADRTVDLVRLDGSQTRLQSDAAGITVTLSTEPVLLLYSGNNAGLAPSLGTPALSLEAASLEAASQEAVSPEAAVQTVRSGEISAFTLTGPGLKAASLHVDGPPLWKTTLKQAGEGRVDVVFEVPESTPAREGRFCVQLKTDDHPIGELTVAVRVDDTDRQAR